MIRLVSILLCVVVVWAGCPAVAQGQEDIEGERIEITASDGWTLVGTFYAAPEDAVGETGAPVILLLHQAGSVKESWLAEIQPLHEAGYALLAVDQRGGGETRGGMTSDNAQTDVQAWLDWLRTKEGVDPARLNLMGGSMGANLALLGMAIDPDVVTAVALSPGLTGGYEQWDVSAVFTGIGDRPVYLVAGQRDDPSGADTKTLALASTGEIQLHMYKSSAHGLGIFMLESDLLPSIIAWLDRCNR